jgi:hypothetical protein
MRYHFESLEQNPNWNSYSQLPPNYPTVTTNPTSGFSRGMTQQGPNTSFSISGSVVGDALYSLQVIGAENNLGITDADHTILPSIHTMEYSGRFYVSQNDLPNVGAIELDIGHYMGEISQTFGTQIRVANTTSGSPPNGWDKGK